MNVVPFLCYEEGKCKVTRKKHQLFLENGHIFPPEGHCCIYLKKYIYVTGGARFTEPATWPLAAEIYRLKFLVEDEDITLEQTNKMTTNGAALPPLAYSRSTEISDDSFILWGGLDTSVMSPVNKLFMLNVKPKSININVAISKEDVPSHPHSPVTENLTFNNVNIQKNVPEARFGHVVFRVKQKIMMFGGMSMPNRHKKTVHSTDLFHLSSCLGSVHLLDMETLTWDTIEMSTEDLQRAYHTAVYVDSSSTVVVVGGIDKTLTEMLTVRPTLVKIQWSDDGKITLFCSQLDVSHCPDVFIANHVVMSTNDGRLLCTAGTQQESPQLQPESSQSFMYYNIEAKDSKQFIWIFDLENKTCEINEYPVKRACIGLTIHQLDNDCFLLLGGSKKQMLLYTSKTLEPEACLHGGECTISHSVVTPIPWVQCDRCEGWLHLHCEGIRAAPRKTKKYICSICKSKK